MNERKHRRDPDCDPVTLESLDEKLDTLMSVVILAHRHEMRQIDDATNEIGAQITDISNGLAPEQQERLRTIVGKLQAIAHQPQQPTKD